MATQDRLVELALNPSETLEVELKGWLDLSSAEDRANVAQAVLALANHGGGVILIGYEEVDGVHREAVAPPPAASSFTTDAVNGMVEKFADPAFHCELHFVEHARLKHRHPAIVVPGGHRVPIRARAGGPNDKHVKKDTYYVRRAGPQSAPPQTAAEWDQLIHRCVMADRDTLLDNLRAALSGEPSRQPEPSLAQLTARWEAESIQRFAEVVKEKAASATYAGGYYTCSYAFAEHPVIDARGLLEHLRVVEHQTGWPVWMVFDRPPIAPYPMNGLVECHVWEAEESHYAAHSDFWRASPDAKFFLLRGHQEDEPDNVKGRAEPRKALDTALPYWRVGECLLHAARMAERLEVPKTPVHFRVTWTGLTDRRLQNLFGDWPDRHGSSPSKQDVVHSELTVDADRIRLQLADSVIALTKPLFEVFGFARPEPRAVQAALAKLLGRTSGR